MIDVGLWLLAGRKQESLLLAVVTLAAWWFLSDYYVARVIWWPEPLDLGAFIAVSIASLALASWWRRKAVRTTLRGPVMTVTFGSGPLPICLARVLLLEATRHVESPPVRDYVRWHAARLGAVTAPIDVPLDGLARAWWWRRRSLVRVWMVSLWLPLLWVVLIAVPQYTGVMEWLAARWHGDRSGIYDVVVSGFAVGAKGERSTARITESIFPSSGRDAPLVRGRTTLLTNGTVTVHAADFPRVYRHVEAICGGAPPACGLFAGDSSLVPEPYVAVPVRAGRAPVGFIQMTPESKLGLTLRLLAWDRTVIDQANIER